jgi:signal transduction histidine kinase
MVSFRSSADRRPRLTPVMVLLLLTLGLTGVFAYQAVDSAASHRRTAEATLDDYAMFAAWEFSRLTRKELEYYLWDYAKTLQYFQPEAPNALPGLIQITKARNKLVECGPSCGSTFFRAYFAVDLSGDDLVHVGEDLGDAEWARIRDTLRLHAPAFYEKKWGLAVVMGGERGRPSFGYYLRLDAWDQPTKVAYGFVFTDSLVVQSLGWPWKATPLLPPALTGVTNNASLLSLQVTDPAGREWFQCGRDFPGDYAGTDTLGLQFGGLTTTVTLNPAVAGDLVIGGLPRSRVPMLLGLLGLTVGLVLVALRQLRRESELVRLRSEFVSGVSHELRTPLAQIRMFAETLLLGRVRSDDERQRALDIVNRESQRLTHLVDNVLQFSRAERGTMRIAPEPTRLDRLLQDLVDCFQPLAQARDVRVRLVADGAVTAPVDAGAVRQVVLNLLDNAVKYGPAGQRVTVELALENDQAVIAVEDQGPGIPTAERTRVWEPYWRLPRDSASAVGGSGIGLAVVKELVQAHGGTVTVAAGTDGGARFVVRFPGATNGSSTPGTVPASDASSVAHSASTP